MENYINGAIKEAIGKGKALMKKIPGARDLGVYFSALATSANREIEQIIDNLDYLYNDPDYNDARNIREKFSRFKQLSGELSKLENVVIAAMSRKSNEDDNFVNKLVQEICKEINYPLQAPVTSCLSQKYYHIYPFYNLLCIPLLEPDFVLHIPDIYHELGHPLLQLDNPKVEGFRTSLGYFLVEIRKHFDAEIQRREFKFNENIYDPIFVWRESWLENWATELFCDLFATYTIGPAYAWSNIHVCTKMSWESYKIPSYQKTTHPPNEARMKAIFYGLQQIGFGEEVPKIQEKWNEFKNIVGEERPQNFATAVPEKLLKAAVEHCLVGTQQIQCEIAKKEGGGKVNALLNNSWVEFWKNPPAFGEWESAKLKSFKETL